MHLVWFTASWIKLSGFHQVFLRCHRGRCKSFKQPMQPEYFYSGWCDPCVKQFLYSMTGICLCHQSIVCLDLAGMQKLPPNKSTAFELGSTFQEFQKFSAGCSPKAKFNLWNFHKRDQSFDLIKFPYVLPTLRRQHQHLSVWKFFCGVTDWHLNFPIPSWFFQGRFKFCILLLRCRMCCWSPKRNQWNFSGHTFHQMWIFNFMDQHQNDYEAHPNVGLEWRAFWDFRWVGG